MNSTKLFVIGDENVIFGFATLGVQGKTVRTREEARQALQTALTDQSLSIVFLSEEWATALREEVDQHKVSVASPLLVEIPGSQPQSERSPLRNLVQTALGIRLEG